MADAKGLSILLVDLDMGFAADFVGASVRLSWLRWDSGRGMRPVVRELGTPLSNPWIRLKQPG